MILAKAYLFLLEFTWITWIYLDTYGVTGITGSIYLDSHGVTMNLQILLNLPRLYLHLFGFFIFLDLLGFYFNDFFLGLPNWIYLELIGLTWIYHQCTWILLELHQFHLHLFGFGYLDLIGRLWRCARVSRDLCKISNLIYLEFIQISWNLFRFT
jgi:hypothetical protein